LNSIDPLSRETYVINVHDAMCVEIMKVVVEACNELKKVRAKYLSLPFRTSSDLGFMMICSLHVHDELNFYS
jgi:hypothetical protein